MFDCLLERPLVLIPISDFWKKGIENKQDTEKEQKIDV